MKLYEIFLRKIGIIRDTPNNSDDQKPQEEKFYNPIGCKIGGVVKIDSIDFRDHRFIVQEIREYSIIVGESKHSMVDYVLLSRPIGKNDFMVRLRVVPNSDSNSRITHRAMVLSLYDDLEYNEGLHNVVRDDTLKFIIDDDKSDSDPTNDVHEEFWRVNDVHQSYVSQVKVLRDRNVNQVGIIHTGLSEVSKFKVEFWDYSRMTEIDGVEIEEFVFVEMNKQTGWFQIWRGAEVISERVEVF